MSQSIKVECTNSGCRNYGAVIELEDWGGTSVSCGPCGRLLVGEADWHQIPSMEDAGFVSRPVQAVNLITQMSEQERTELVRLINSVVP